MAQVYYCLLRDVPASVAAGIQDFQAAPQQVDVSRARAQHASYAAALRRNPAVAEVLELPASDAEPDSVFVEDAAICAAGLLLPTRPARPSRASEVASLLAAPQLHDLLKRSGVALVAGPEAAQPEGQNTPQLTLEGGDVLQIGEKLMVVGLSTRSNAAAVAWLKQHLAPRGMAVVGVPVPRSTLHLKSLLSWAGPEVGLVVTDSADGRELLNSIRETVAKEAAATLVEGAADLTRAVFVPDALGSNVLRVGQTVYWHAGSTPATHAIFQALAAQLAGQVAFEPLDMSELARLDGALTCCSIIWQRRK